MNRLSVVWLPLTADYYIISYGNIIFDLRILINAHFFRSTTMCKIMATCVQVATITKLEKFSQK
jgi:hypothetical protein